MRSTITVTTALIFFQIGAFGQVDTLTDYSASTRQLQTNNIPAEVFRLTNLRHLAITGMDCDYREIDEKGNDVTKCWGIREIPADIKDLRNLETLILRLNYIETIPPEIIHLKKLRSLDMTDNPGLANIESIIGLENLEELVLFGCNLTFLPKGIGRLKKLKYLGLTGNNIDSEEQKRIKKALPGCDIKF